MQRLRSHIIKYLVLGMVCCGFSLYLVQPAKANPASKALSSWLDSAGRGAQAPDLKKEINRLRSEGAGLTQLIDYASRALGKDADELRSAVQSQVEFQEICRLLLMGWNPNRTAQGMTPVPPAPSMKPAAGLQVDKFSTPGWGLAAALEQQALLSSAVSAGDLPAANGPSLVPMEDGIAIGAP